MRPRLLIVDTDDEDTFGYMSEGWGNDAELRAKADAAIDAATDRDDAIHLLTEAGFEVIGNGHRAKGVPMKGQKVTIHRITVTLNGTDENPFARWGLRQNPFSQIARAEHDRAMLTVQSLGGEPIPDTDWIRKVLEGFDPEFVQLCCDQFRKGETVKFDVLWPD